MKSTHNAAGQPAGAGTLHVSASQIALLIEVAVLAMQDSRQQLAVKETYSLYISSLHSFEAKHGRVEGRIDPLNPSHGAIIAASRSQFETYQRAKRNAYNIRRRLQTACRKAAWVNAERAQAVSQ
jgi:hypothetical protein